MRALLIGTVLAFVLSGCNPNPETADTYQGNSAERDKLVATITSERMAIEARKQQLTRNELPTDKLSERIKQKWIKIDFYSENGNLLRVKSYPHPTISTRTEEFYFRDGKLILAYIEDNGTETESGGVHTKGKEYFYSDGKFVAENNLSGETEKGIRQSDEEGLEAEAMEYQELFKTLK